ncbi:Methyltransferase-like protein 13 [Chionoecetes opilio]|uniref:Methyltransferase-like protein 13 n=1 Tax=Chionoecetes opilio TaxID=41210 RepID=A0A8J4YTB9_CHIOP|nr:Methyltransferase-like protein 13 [Chionoecetes opilio]
MSLLPKTFQDFTSKHYWNSFFSKRGEKAFEWYGEYTELCGLLHKYMRPTDAILVAGCGNSTLSADLYRVGYSQITSVDNSEVVIRQMRDKYKQQCPKMEWLKMDLSAMDFEDGSFSCVLDKAALDALMTDASLPVIEFIDKYLNLSLIVLGGQPLRGIRMLRPGALHRARWMAKIIYAIKIYLFRDPEQFRLTAGEKSGI